MIEDCKWRCECVSDWCVSCDGPLTCPGCNPASHPVTAGADSKPFWYGFIHGENRDLDIGMALLFLQNICLLWCRMIVCERKHLALLLILIVSCHLSMWHFLVLFSVQGPEIHPHWWVHAPSDISVPNCSLWATELLLCVSGVYVAQRANSQASIGPTLGCVYWWVGFVA